MPVPDGLAGLRLDAALARIFGLSRTAAAAIVEAGDASVDGTPASKSDRVHAGAWLEVVLPGARAPYVAAPGEVVAGLTVVHEDDDIIVVDKPPGVASHPSPGYDGPTVIGGLLGAGHTIATSGAAERQGIVHRLDVGTSGLMVVAKSERAYSVLKQAFRERRVDKRYHTVVQGLIDPTSGTIDAPLDRHPSHPYKFAVVAGGKPSITHYELLEAFRAAALLEVRLETGRTHQIRVHMAAMRHPCVGDTQYGADPTLTGRLGLQRQWLHAVHLAFEHPGDGRAVAYQSGYPDDLAAPLEQLRNET
ncbi:MAG TPA: RluA family pseudouridine synthase [Mycobacteriales bacterium]|jgi:23S rRNA pseudouridine1911/1915/1917 synthase|nr:RluA family pseudouridine synthase [Mycobacteriales bacterium]